MKPTREINGHDLMSRVEVDRIFSKLLNENYKFYSD